MLQTAKTIAGVARVGPIAGQANKIRELLEDRERSGYVAVALPEEMPITETLELQETLRRAVGRDLEAIIVNAVRPRRFTKAELERIDPLTTSDGAVGRAAVKAAHFASRRTAGEQAQLRRLRKHAEAPVVTLPYLFEPDLRVEDLELLAAELDKRL
jgi:anion-transporting  ArsA/GET3 family ATPase